MGASDYYRPAENQIKHHYKCDKCGHETEVESCYASPDRCYCGGYISFVGESYPSNAADWDEQRDPDGEWRPRRG